MIRLRRVRLLMIVLLIALVGWWSLGGESLRDSGHSGLAIVAGHVVSESEFAAYMASKGIQVHSSAQRQALLDRYLEEVALAAAIEQETGDALTRLDAEVAEFRRQRLIRSHFDEVTNLATSDQAVQEYVASQESKLRRQEVHVAHLLVSVQPGMSEDEREGRRARAMQLLEQARGGDFAKLAEIESEDRASAPRGGDLGWISAGQIDEVLDVALELRVGEVSAPVESAHGYHLVKLLEPPRLSSSTDAAALMRVREHLRQSAREAERRRLLAKANVSLHEQTLPTETEVLTQSAAQAHPKPLYVGGSH